VTVPIIRNYSGVRLISEMQVNNETNWRDKLLKTIQANYGKAPYYKAVAPMLHELILNPVDSLAEYNIVAIRTLSSVLGIDTGKLVLGNDLDAEGSATDLLISMTNKLGGSTYMCGGGAGGYQEDEKFAAAGIELVYQGFKHPVYQQCRAKEFVPGLSIIDALMNCGIDGTRDSLSLQVTAEPHA
jgi:hypothetical protein